MHEILKYYFIPKKKNTLVFYEENMLIFCRKIINKIGFNNHKKHTNIPYVSRMQIFKISLLGKNKENWTEINLFEGHGLVLFVLEI